MVGSGSHLDRALCEGARGPSICSARSHFSNAQRMTSSLPFLAAPELQSITEGLLRGVATMFNALCYLGYSALVFPVMRGRAHAREAKPQIREASKTLF